MRVEDSHVQLQASRHHVEGHGKKDGLDIKERRDHIHHHEGNALGHNRRPDPVAISDEARARFESMKQRFSETRGREFSVPGGLDPRGFLNRLILRAFTGKDINVTGLVDQGQGRATLEALPTRSAPALSPVDAVEAASTQAISGAKGFSAEIEQLSFSASGTIRTADGEEVGFTLELNVTRAILSGYSAESATGGQDGLSVNFGGSSAELFSMSFEFNIASQDEGVQSGLGSFKVDKPETDSVSDDDHDGSEDSLASNVPDFLKLLRRAEFNSTYLSFSRTAIEAGSSFFEGQPADSFPAPGPASAQPIDVLV